MKKVLIVRLSSLGDVILTSAVIDPLIEAGYKPYILTYKPFGDVFDDDQRVKVIKVDRNGLFEKSLIETLKKEEFEIHIDLHKKLKTFVLRMMLKGHWISYRKLSLRRRLGIKIKFLLKNIPSVTEMYTEPLRRYLGINGKYLPKILIKEERVKKWREKFGNNFITICTGARYRKKIYPYFDKIADILCRKGYKVVFLGDERDKEMCKNLKGINMCGELSLTDTLAVIKASSLFIGNDSGLTHGARAVKTKAIQIFGGTHPILGFGLFKEEGKVISKDLQCQPCDLHGKGVCKYGTYECLDIDPEIIVECVEHLLS